MTPSQVASPPPQPVKALSDTDAAPESSQEMQQPVQAQETNQGAADTLDTLDRQSSLALGHDPVPELSQQSQLASDPQDQRQDQDQGHAQDPQAMEREISDTLDNTGAASSDSKEPGSDPPTPHHQQQPQQQEEEGAEDPAQRKTDDSALEPSPQSAPSTPVPKQSAWSTLLPGVAPIPAPKPPAPMAAPRSTAAKSAENIRQLHELYPIVLPHESEVKLSMEMIDLFEVRDNNTPLNGFFFGPFLSCYLCLDFCFFSSLWNPTG